MWPRIDGDSAHQSFATTLHRLRKLLGEERTIQLSDGKLTLDGRLIWVDIWAFDQIIARINQALRPKFEETAIDSAKLSDLGTQLLERYAGPFLASEPEQAWSLPLRDRLRQRFVRTVVAITHYLQQASAAEHAIDLLEHAIELDYSSESIYRNLMECYASLGRRAEAVDTYGRCRNMLAATLRVDPSPETTAVYEKLTRAA